jgi:hypothetical protein
MAKGRGRVGDRSSVEGQRRRQARGVDGQGRGGRCLTVNRQVEVANVRQRRAADAAEPWSGRRHEGEHTAVGWRRSRRPTDLWGICGRGVNSQKYDVIWGAAAGALGGRIPYFYGFGVVYESLLRIAL